MNRKKDKLDKFMTVGELAKKMGTTVRTLQYYDKEGLLSPEAISEGGRRLYTYKDMVKLHQILSLKSLGFSLNDIKNRLVSLDTPEQVATVLNEQSLTIQQQIEQLSKALTAIEVLKEEVLQMQVVDFKKYADIIVNFQMNNEYYWLIKHFDDVTLDHIRTQFDKESGMNFMKRFNQLNDRALKLKEKKVAPEDQQAQALAKDFWDMVIEFTNGDMSMIPKLMKFDNLVDNNKEWVEKQKIVNEYLQPALEIYFENIGMNVFKEGAECQTQ